MRSDFQLTGRARLHDFFTGLDRDLHDARRIGGGCRRSLSNPIPQDLIRFAPRFEPLTAAVRHFPGGLEQQQTALGRRARDAPPAPLFDQCLEIKAGVEPEQRQFESVLPAGFAVAAPRVATEPAEDRLDVVGEVDLGWRLLGGPRDWPTQKRKASTEPRNAQGVLQFP